MFSSILKKIGTQPSHTHTTRVQNVIDSKRKEKSIIMPAHLSNFTLTLWLKYRWQINIQWGEKIIRQIALRIKKEGRNPYYYPKRDWKWESNLDSWASVIGTLTEISSLVCLILICNFCLPYYQPASHLVGRKDSCTQSNLVNQARYKSKLWYQLKQLWQL